MRTVIALTVIALFAMTVVAAVVFRQRRAWDLLHFLRRAGWAYVLVIVLVAAWRLWG